MTHPPSTDRFENFLMTHKPAIDVDFDEERVWLAVSGKLQRKKSLRRKVMAIAASLVILLSVSVWIFFSGLPRAGSPEKGLAGDLQGFAGAEIGSEARLFSFAVEQKLAEVQKTGADPAAIRELSAQLALVDRHQARYMADLKEVGPDPRILRGIIRCYEQKIRIIEKTLNRIEKTSRDEALPKFRII